jgi:hypothetical protein
MMFLVVIGFFVEEHTKVSAAAAECFMYLAPSTIPGAGLGVFAGSKAYKEGDFVSPGDIVIPIIDQELHHPHDDWEFLWDEYTWSESIHESLSEETDQDRGGTITAASLGMGATPNCLLSLVNLVEEDTIELDLANVDSSSPGSGAFTPYHNRIFSAYTDIKPGQELFVSYGASYFRHRSHIYGPMPEEHDYVVADSILTTFDKLDGRLGRNESRRTTTTTTTDKLDGRLGRNENSMTTTPDSSNQITSVASSLWNVLQNFKMIWPESGPLLALPLNLELVGPILADGGTAYQHYNRSIRDLDWLETHGVCMDNIESKNSTIPHAGRGAFATRHLPKGSIITPAPLIHVPNSSVLEFYDLDARRPTPKRSALALRYLNETINTTEDRKQYPIHSQLLRNYCFGHPESTLLLCPYGLLNGHINHSSKKANAKLQWSLGTGRMRHEEWLNMSIDEWGDEFHAGLAFDIVALRDISKGQEILIDYGDAWEAAWRDHVAHFDSRGTENFVFAARLEEDPTLKIRTMYEGSYDKQHKRIQCRTHFAYLRGLYRSFLEPTEPGLHECRVVERDENNDTSTYTVEFMEYWSEGGFCYSEVLAILWDLPRDVFYFADQPYSRPHSRRSSFRHEMGIPDTIFPEKWKNRLLADAGHTHTATNKEPSEAPKQVE